LAVAAPPHVGRRLVVMLVVMVIALVVIAGKLVSLQGSDRAHYDALSRGQLLRSTKLEPTRGAIVDRNGADLALSVPRPTVFVDPSAIVRPHATARRLAAILHQPVAQLDATLTRTDTRYVVLARQVGAKVEAAIRKLDNPGVALQAGSQRVLPNRDLAGPVIGYVNGEGKGAGGIERGYERTLRGRAGRLDAERDPTGREIPATERKLRPAVAGSDVVLTIDRGLQYQVERQLTAEVASVKAKGGMAILADVHSGDILAAAVVDGASKGVPAHPAPPTEGNRLFTTPYEPGSTNKVITIASALENHTIQPDEQFDVPAHITIGGAPFDDDEWHPESMWSIRQILPASSNVGTIKIAATLGQSRLERSLREFGLGVRTAVAFPGESYGTLQAPDQGDPTIMGSLPIGYGVNVTAAQMLGVYMTIANDGVTRPLRLVDGTIDAAGNRHRARSMPSRRVISTGTADILNDLMRDVVTKGTGVEAKIPGYTVAGKTGTARKQPYSRHRYMASFAGFAPAEAPRFAAVVVLDEPRTKIYGGAVAAPVFSKIMQAALRQERVPPTVAIDPSTDPTNASSGGATGKVSRSVP
jgi:cell division protein FtsI (penicillin-binding protein 3)